MSYSNPPAVDPELMSSASTVIHARGVHPAHQAQVQNQAQNQAHAQNQGHYAGEDGSVLPGMFQHAHDDMQEEHSLVNTRAHPLFMLCLRGSGCLLVCVRVRPRTRGRPAHASDLAAAAPR